MASSQNVVEVNDKNFDTEVLASEFPVLVDFGATWCGPCKMLAPIVAKIADENVGRFKIVKVDIDDSPEISQRYGIRAAPTVLVFDRGEKKAQHTGLTTKEKLLALLGKCAERPETGSLRA